MSVKPARLPKNLGSEGRRLWRQIASQVASDGLEMDKRELEMLLLACQESDQLAGLVAALVDQPMVVRGAQGNLVAHPLIGEARRSRAAIQSLLKTIGLEDPAAEGKGRGSRTTSTQARTAAMRRHRGGA